MYTAITTPPNYAFQLSLEAGFPARTVIRSASAQSKAHSKATRGVTDAQEETRLSVRNTIIKFFLDQSLAATVNTAMYICLMGSIKGHSWDFIQQDLYNVSEAVKTKDKQSYECSADEASFRTSFPCCSQAIVSSRLYAC